MGRCNRGMELVRARMTVRGRHFTRPPRYRDTLTSDERREAWSMVPSDTPGHWLAYDYDDNLIGEFVSEEEAENAKR